MWKKNTNIDITVFIYGLIMKGTMSLRHRCGTSNRKYTALNRYEVDTYKQKIPTNLSLNLKNEVMFLG
jgi:hypothetical protein